MSRIVSETGKKSIEITDKLLKENDVLENQIYPYETKRHRTTEKQALSSVALRTTVLHWLIFIL